MGPPPLDLVQCGRCTGALVLDQNYEAFPADDEEVSGMPRNHRRRDLLVTAVSGYPNASWTKEDYPA